jgi:NMD protein affecting ribosome stability and mRNA decay
MQVNLLLIIYFVYFNLNHYFRFETSKRLISHDIHSNIYNYKYTTLVEIVPICKVKLKKTKCFRSKK